MNLPRTDYHEEREDNPFKAKNTVVCFVGLRVFVMSPPRYERTCPVHAG
jgi:hypothetical protein